jgi:hypothetical protein
MRRYDYRETHRCEPCPPCSTCAENRRIAPDPKVFNYLESKEVGDYIILKIKYPNCTNYEGIKILVFKAKLFDIVKQANIDPHFTDKKNYISPIARFEPTERGWNMALEFVAFMCSNKDHK